MKKYVIIIGVLFSTFFLFLYYRNHDISLPFDRGKATGINKFTTVENSLYTTGKEIRKLAHIPGAKMIPQPDGYNSFSIKMNSIGDYAIMSENETDSTPLVSIYKKNSLAAFVSRQDKDSNTTFFRYSLSNDSRYLCFAEIQITALENGKEEKISKTYLFDSLTSQTRLLQSLSSAQNIMPHNVWFDNENSVLILCDVIQSRDWYKTGEEFQGKLYLFDTQGNQKSEELITIPTKGIKIGETSPQIAFNQETNSLILFCGYANAQTGEKNKTLVMNYHLPDKTVKELADYPYRLWLKPTNNPGVFLCRWNPTSNNSVEKLGFLKIENTLTMTEMKVPAKIAELDFVGFNSIDNTGIYRGAIGGEEIRTKNGLKNQRLYSVRLDQK